MTFLDSNVDNNITINVRVNKFNSFVLPRDDSNYKWKGTDSPLHHLRIECTGVQCDNDATFPVDLSFLTGLYEYELEELRGCYEIGKLIRVKGNFFASLSDGNGWRLTITDPLASYLPEVVIKSFEVLTGAQYLPQQTLESAYELP